MPLIGVDIDRPLDRHRARHPRENARRTLTGGESNRDMELPGGSQQPYGLLEGSWESKCCIVGALFVGVDTHNVWFYTPLNIHAHGRREFRDSRHGQAPILEFCLHFVVWCLFDALLNLSCSAKTFGLLS